MFSYYGQKGTILRALKIHKRLGVGFYQKGSYMVGWKAGTRICELVRSGYLRRSEIDEIGKNGQRMATYSLTSKGFNLRIDPPTFIDQIKHAFNKYK